MRPPSYRCCQTVFTHGRFLHQCRMSQAERDEINYPDSPPGIEWRRVPRRDGKMWERKVKPRHVRSSVPEGHVLLDRHMVHVNVLGALNGNSFKTR